METIEKDKTYIEEHFSQSFVSLVPTKVWKPGALRAVQNRLSLESTVVVPVPTAIPFQRWCAKLDSMVRRYAGEHPMDLL